MDNKQLRTAMVALSMSRYMGSMLGEDGVNVAVDEKAEGFQRIHDWRTSLNLDLSIAARGATEGLWYIDLVLSPEPAWADFMAAALAPHEMMVSVKKPNKMLVFNPDQSPAPLFQKIKFPSTEVCFVNCQALWNFEQFLRDQSPLFEGKPYADIDYSVVDISEIGQGEARDFDLITMHAYDCNTNKEVLIKSVEALASGGVLLINVNNNSGKLYRDDYWFHPYNEMHEVLKSYEGFIFHDSAQHGYTVFVKD